MPRRVDPVSASRFHVSDELWQRIQELLPKHKNTHRYGGGRPRASDRTVMDGILFVLRTGCQWNALNDTSICSSSTAHRRFQEWEAAGVFRRLWKVSLENYDELRGIDWSWQAMDGAMTKAPLGGEKGGPQPHGSGQGGRQKKPTDRRRRDPARPRGGRRKPA
jgi:putative transposase